MDQLYLIYGGRSTEHEISCRSAQYIFDHYDRSRYELHAVFIDKDGSWFKLDRATHSSLRPIKDGPDRQDFSPWQIPQTAIVFPMLHGTYGEDGSIQGLFDLMSICYVGCDTTASALAMDKSLTKSLVKAAGVPVLECVEIRDPSEIDISELKDRLGWPLFVKPTRQGSAVGAHKITKERDFQRCLQDALRFDESAIVEAAIDCRELEVAALGGYTPKISTVGEVVVEGDSFYTYDAKYLSKNAAKTVIPAKLSNEKIEQIRHYATVVYKSLKLYGLSRIDFFQDRSNDALYFNEVNTIPGFTSISQYPMLWEHAGYSPTQLINELLDLAKLRHKSRLRLSRSFQSD